MVAIKEEEMEIDSKTEVTYEAKCALTIPIARPLAPRKLSKKLYKCSKAAMKVPHFLQIKLVPWSFSTDRL